jgi:hypothetical protein
MSLQVYSLTSTAFRPIELRNEQSIARVIAESLRYWLSRIFGCWHRQMSRPFTHGDHTYRTCARCGMRRDFDLQSWKMKGRFYRDQVSRVKLTLMRKTERSLKEKAN